MEPIHLTTREALIWSVIINAVLGFVLGLIPLLFGKFYKQLRTGFIAILITTVGGAALGVLISIPATIIFTWLISRRERQRIADASLFSSEPTAAEPVDAVTEDHKN